MNGIAPLAIGILAIGFTVPLSPQRPFFTASASRIVVDVTVTNEPRGLTVHDFLLKDNGITQHAVELVDVGSIGVDLTLLVDVSPSVVVNPSRFRDHVDAAARAFRTGDTLRVVTFSSPGALREVLPPTVLPVAVPRSVHAVPGDASAVRDALLAVLAHPGSPSRRAAVVVMTDGEDFSSAVSSEQLIEVARRSDPRVYVLSAATRRPVSLEERGGHRAIRKTRATLEAIAADTGGAVYDWRNLTRAFQDLRQSLDRAYILAYQPQDLSPGWHTLAVELPGMPEVRGQSRRGYFRPAASARQ